MKTHTHAPAHTRSHTHTCARAQTDARAHAKNKRAHARLEALPQPRTRAHSAKITPNHGFKEKIYVHSMSLFDDGLFLDLGKAIAAIFFTTICATIDAITTVGETVSAIIAFAQSFA